MKELRRIYFRIHPNSWEMYAKLGLGDAYFKEWEGILINKNRKDAAIVIIHGSHRAQELEDLCIRHFKERCFINPYDDSPETQLLLFQDLERMFHLRGSYDEWIPYELWSSNNARRWTEGLKSEMKKRGYFFDPEKVEMESWGNIWSGCSIKYTTFLAKYLGLSHPMKRSVELPVKTGWPLKVKEFLGSFSLDHYVQLFLFTTRGFWSLEDDRPVAMFIDGLRGVWEPPHIAIVPIGPDKVSEVYTISPNSFVKVRDASKVLEDRVIADVGDGCHPAFTILIGKEDVAPSEFKSTMLKAKITDRDDRCRFKYATSIGFPEAYHDLIKHNTARL